MAAITAAGTGWPVKVGFLGTGFIATYHSKSLRGAQKRSRQGGEPDVQVEWAGVYDPDADKAAAFAQSSGAPLLGSEQEVIDASDAVYVTTWTSEHPRLVQAVVDAGKAVFCEKPLAVDLASAAALVAAVQGSGVVNQVGLVLRHSPAFHLAKQLVEAPESGRFMSVVFRDDQYIPIQGQYGSDWRADRTKAGSGTLLEHSIHDLDLIEWLLGPMSSVNARSADFHEIDGIEDLVVATLAWPSGATGTLTSIWHDVLSRPSLRRVEVFCERAHIVVDDDWFGPVSWTRDDGSGVLQGEELLAAAGLEGAGPMGPNPDAEFVTAVAEGRAASPDVAAALRAHQLADAVYRSAAASGAPIDVAP
jgi:predicted dehydrogenase